MSELIPVMIHRSNILNSNAMAKHSHWSDRSEPVKVLRALGATHFRTAELPRYQRLHVTAKVSYPDRFGRDVMNLYPTMKAFVDGMVNDVQRYTMVNKGGKLRKKKLAPDPTFGILPDDNDRYLVGPHMEWSGRLSGRKDHYLFEIKLTALGPLEVEV